MRETSAYLHRARPGEIGEWLRFFCWSYWCFPMPKIGARIPSWTFLLFLDQFSLRFFLPEFGLEFHGIQTQFAQVPAKDGGLSMGHINFLSTGSSHYL